MPKIVRRDLHKDVRVDISNFAFLVDRHRVMLMRHNDPGIRPDDLVQFHIRKNQQIIIITAAAAKGAKRKRCNNQTDMTATSFHPTPRLMSSSRFLSVKSTN